jgi:hypothetical protein
LILTAFFDSNDAFFKTYSKAFKDCFFSRNPNIAMFEMIGGVGLVWKVV